MIPAGEADGNYANVLRNEPYGRTVEMPTANPGIGFNGPMARPEVNIDHNASREPKRKKREKNWGMPQGALEKYFRPVIKSETPELRNNNGDGRVNQITEEEPGTSATESVFIDPNVIFNSPAPVSRTLNVDGQGLQKRAPPADNVADVAAKRFRQDTHVKNLKFDRPDQNQASSVENGAMKSTSITSNSQPLQRGNAVRRPNFRSPRNESQGSASVNGTIDTAGPSVRTCSSGGGLLSVPTSQTKQGHNKVKGRGNREPTHDVPSISDRVNNTDEEHSILTSDATAVSRVGTSEADERGNELTLVNGFAPAQPFDTIHPPLTSDGPQLPATGKGIRGYKRKVLEIVPNGDHTRLEKLLQEQKWAAVFASINEWLKVRVFPNETVTAKIITDILLPKTKGRGKKPGGVDEAMRFLTHFLKEVPHHENWEDFINECFKTANKKLRERDPPENFVTKLLAAVDSESQKEEKLAFNLFQSLTELLVTEFECNKQRNVKIRYPQIILLMVWDELSKQLISFNSNWNTLLTQIFKFPSNSVEAKTLVQWVDLLVLQYHDMRAGVGGDDDRELQYLVSKTHLHLKSVKQESRLSFLKLFRVKEFASDLCKKLIQDKIPISTTSIINWDSVLNELSAHVPSYETDNTEFVNLEKLPDKYRHKHENLMKKKNAKGETILHLAAASQGSSRYSEVQAEKYILFREMHYYKFGDVNIRDNGGNTPLHDAAFNNNLEMIAAIWKDFVHKNDPVSPWQLDILAQDNEGHTALHNAIQQGHKEVILRLAAMSKVLCRSTALFYKLRNKWGDTAWDTLTKKSSLSDDEEIHDRVRHIVGHPPMMRRYFGGCTFSEEAAKIIDSDRHLWTLILYWRNVQNNRSH